MAGGSGFNPYAAGHKVYNGGLAHAQSGTADPSGYIEREHNKPNKGNAPQSDSRSGLAAKAINAGKNDSKRISYPPTTALLMAHGLEIHPTGKIRKMP